jgi:hypothetical protein
MVLVYHGTVPRLIEEAKEYEDRLNARYLEILGKDRYARLDRLVDKFLTSDCFFNSKKEFGRMFGEDISGGNSSKLIFITDVSPNRASTGRLKVKQAKVAYGFYVNEDSFRNSGSANITDKIIATYVHEFDHFVLSILQNPPLPLALPILTDAFGSMENQSDVFGLASKLGDSDIPIPKKVEQMTLGLSAYCLTDVWESATRILDKMVLESIGIEVPLEWRGKRRIRKEFNIQGVPTRFLIPSGGDPFLGQNDQKIVDMILKWPDYFSPTMRVPYMDNFYDSLKGLRARTVLLDPKLGKTHRNQTRRDRRVEMRNAGNGKKKRK